MDQFALYKYKLVSKDAISDPYLLTGSWVVAENPNQAFQRLGLVGGWGINSQAILVIRDRYNLVSVETAFTEFSGTRDEFIEAVRQSVIGEHELYWFTPKAITQARIVERERRAPAARRASFLERVEDRLRALAAYRYLILTTLGLVGVIAGVVGCYFFHDQLLNMIGPASGFAVVWLTVWFIFFRKSTR